VGTSISGNDRADSLAKEGAEKEQAVHPSTNGETHTVVRHDMKKRWREKHLDSRIIDTYPQLTRQEEITVFHLPTGTADFDDTHTPN